MGKCKNPECQKEVIKGMDYCSNDCLQRMIALKQEIREKKITSELADESNLWLGQEKRKRAMTTILKIAEKILPMDYEDFIAQLIFRCGLTKRKLEEDYVQPLIRLKFLGYNTNTLVFIKREELQKEENKISQSFTDDVKEKK